MSTNAELNHGTTAEKAFLDQIAEGPRAAMLLSNYIAASEKRVAWGSIDRAEVIAYAGLLYGNAIARATTMQRLAGQS